MRIKTFYTTIKISKEFVPYQEYKIMLKVGTKAPVFACDTVVNNQIKRVAQKAIKAT